MTLIAEFDLSRGAGRRRPKSCFLAICLLLVMGLTAATQGETNVARSGVMDTHHTYVIDVRTKGEWKAGHIKSAILIPYDQINARIGEVTTNKSASIAIYCRSGRRSRIALESLQKLGYLKVENLGSLHEARKKLGDN
jgi:phage shock protein E